MDGNGIGKAVERAFIFFIVVAFILGSLLTWGVSKLLDVLL